VAAVHQLRCERHLAAQLSGVGTDRGDEAGCKDRREEDSAREAVRADPDCMLAVATASVLPSRFGGGAQAMPDRIPNSVHH
jgi:hypothetical protein